MPFRDAYHIVGDVVNLAEKLGKDISQLSIEELKSVDSRIDSKAVEILDNSVSMNSRNSFGGTSTEQTEKQIEILRVWLQQQKL